MYGELIEMPKGIDVWHDISDENKKIIETYIQDLTVEGTLSSLTIRSYLIGMRTIARLLNNKSLCDVTNEDMKEILLHLQKKYKVGTIDTYKVTMLKFFKRLHNDDRPACIQCIKLRGKRQKQRESNPDENDLKQMSDDEYEKMVEGAKKLYIEKTQTLAMLEVFRWFGCRNAELCSLKLDSCGKDDIGTFITIYESKTKPRKIYITDNPMNYFHEWLNIHPLRGQEDASCWISLHGRKRFHQTLDKHDIRHRFNAVKRLTDINRPMTPKMLRHRCMNYRILERGEDPMQMSFFFGTSIKTINENYLHRKQDEYLKWISKKRVENGEVMSSYTELEQEKNKLQDEFEKRFQDMERQFKKKMDILDSSLAQATKQHLPDYPSAKIIEDYKRLEAGLKDMLEQMVKDGKSKGEIDSFKKLIKKGLT